MAAVVLYFGTSKLSGFWSDSQKGLTQDRLKKRNQEDAELTGEMQNYQEIKGRNHRGQDGQHHTT